MKSFFRKNIFAIFWVLVALEITGLILHIHELHFFIKPLLIPALIAATLLRTIKTSGRKKIIGALFFSFLGDVFLLFESKSSIFFILGLFYFLLTHVFYIVYFMELKKRGTNANNINRFAAIPIAIYTLALLYLLMPGLGDLKIPVIIYACVISLMLYFSFNLPAGLNRTARYLFILGAAFFVLSDSLLAINKFYQPFSFATVAIMLTYCLAQFLIVKGFIINND